jgi:hypothetical protein
MRVRSQHIKKKKNPPERYANKKSIQWDFFLGSDK